MSDGPKKQTIEDLLALPDHLDLEFINGEIVPRYAPNTGPAAEHSATQAATASFTHRRYMRGPGGRWPGGWWILTEVDVLYPTELCRHDIAGWRRDRVAEAPAGVPIKTRPDWVCEVLSPGNIKRDLVEKHALLRDAGVPHYWVLHPTDRILVVHRLEGANYVVALTAAADQTVRAEPFAEVELRVATLFGEPDDE